MSLSATLFGRDSFIFKATNILGLGIPGFLDRTFGPGDQPGLEGPRLSDLSVQTATYGADIPRMYATCGATGNLLWLENNKLKEVVKKSKSGGKGGSKSKSVKTYTYFATFAIGICEGPIEAIGRVWCGDTLIYNPLSTDLDTLKASNTAQKGWKLYLGDDTQLPDPRMQANIGAANSPGYRGLAYIVFYDFALAKYSNTLQAAQFKFEVYKKPIARDSYDILVVDIPDPDPFFAWGSMIVGGKAQLTSNSYDEIRYQIINHDGTFEPIVTIEHTGAMHPLLTNRLVASDHLEEWCVPRYEVPKGFYTSVPGPGVDGSWPIAAVDHDGGDGCWAERDNIWWLRPTGIPGPGTAWEVRSVYGTPGAVVHTLTSFACMAFHGGQAFVHTLPPFGYFLQVYDVTPTSWTLVRTVPGLSNISSIANAYCDGQYFYGKISGVHRINVFTGAGRFMGLPADAVTGSYGFSIANGNNITYMSPGPTLDKLQFRDGYLYAGTEVTTVGDIVRAEMELSSTLRPEDIDVSELTDVVRGYRVSGSSIRQGIEPLQMAWPFDCIQSGYVIRCRRRGGAYVATIPFGLVGATTADDAKDIVKDAMEMDTQLPAKTTVNYLDAVREYSTSSQYFERLTTLTVNKVDKELSIVLTADEAAKMAEILTLLPWLERSQLEFTLPPIYNHLEPSDSIVLQTPWAIYELRLTKIAYGDNNVLSCSAVPEKSTLYTSIAVGGEAPPPPDIIALPGPCIFVPCDIPVVTESLQADPGFVGVVTGSNETWPGAELIRSSDSGQTWTVLQAYNGKATIGNATNTLDESTGELIDMSVLNVKPITGTFEGISRDAMLAGQHFCAYGFDGRWEIVQFYIATLKPDLSYDLSGFVRGARGTERNTGNHSNDDYFILLDDPDNAVIGMPTELIGIARPYKAVTVEAEPDDAPEVIFTYNGVNLKPLSPVSPFSLRDGSSNLTVNFTRRSRFQNSWWTNGIQSPVAETELKFEVDIVNVSTVVRTITTTTESFSYSAADQTTDFGSPQSSIAVRIYQISSTIGRGFPLQVNV